MAKRQFNQQNQQHKKAKYDSLNDFWDDDLDCDLIDCFDRATQEQPHSSQQKDVTLLPSYSIFQEGERGMRTSTQTSHNFGSKSIESRLNELQEKYAEKEGEVCILRANLQKLSASYQAEQEKKETELRDKLIGAQRDNKSIRSELEFKNLEIINLKQQLAEFSRHVAMEQNATQKARIVESKNVESPQEVSKEVAISNPKIQVTSQKYYPLKHFDFSLIFEPDSEREIQSKILVGAQNFGMDDIYPQLAYLITLSLEEFNSEAAEVAINKVVCVSFQILSDFYNYLIQTEESLEVQDVQRSDSEFPQQNRNSIRDRRDIFNRLGVKSAKLIGFLSDVLPFSTSLGNALLRDRVFSVNNFDTGERFVFFKLLLDVVSTIRRIRKEQLCTIFLSSVIELLNRIFSSSQFSDSKTLILDILMEILFLRPNPSIDLQIVLLLKLASRYSDFIDMLCCKSDQVIESDNSNIKKESCRFSVLASSLQNTLSSKLEEDLILQISSNVLIFIFNIFRSHTHWLDLRENKKCKCLYYLYKLPIDIIYKNLKLYKATSVHLTIFKTSVKILNLLTFNSYDLTQKYVKEFARFKEIVYTLIQSGENLDKDILKNLEKLNSGEEVANISSDGFTKIAF